MPKAGCTNIVTNICVYFCIFIHKTHLYMAYYRGLLFLPGCLAKSLNPPFRDSVLQDYRKVSLTKIQIFLGEVLCFWLTSFQLIPYAINRNKICKAWAFCGLSYNVRSRSSSSFGVWDPQILKPQLASVNNFQYLIILTETVHILCLTPC